jgi:hypothetical protein
MKATLIIDDSGSMGTYEKNEVIRQLISQLNFQILTQSSIYSCYDFILWGKTVRYFSNMIEHTIIDQIPFVNQGDHTSDLFLNLDSLLQQNQISNHIFLLSDGFFSKKISENLKSWQKSNQNHIQLSFVCIGADSEVFRLKKVILNQSLIFLGENFLTAINLKKHSNSVKIPNTVEDLDQINILSKHLHHLLVNKEK